jgi:digalactosyldiacylglycerol synthase
MDKFKHVVGIIHTNYVMYSKSIQFGQLAGSMIYILNQVVVRAYCSKVIKLSAALQEFAPEKEIVCNVHGK